MHAKFTSKLSTKTHLDLPLPLPLPLTTLALPPLIISLTKIAFNSGDTSVNEIVMGFPPFLAPVSVETAFPCPPVALFGACCAMLLEAVVFCPPTIDLAHSSLRLWLCFGICCSSGSGFICNESSDIDDKKPQKLKGDHGGVATTSRQSETSRRKQCESVSKKSRGLNLHLYHLERNVHPGTRLQPALGLVRVQVSSDIAYLTFPWGCHLWPCLLFFLGFFFRSSRLAIEHLNWMAPGAPSWAKGC